MKAEVRVVEGLALAAKGDSNHWVAMDALTASGGTGGASNPMELLLMAFGGCMIMGVATILRKKSPDLKGLSVKLDAEQSPSTPRVFTDIKAKFIVHGEDIKESDVEWAINNTHEKFCPVGAMLSKSVKINYEWEFK
ncbi:MAG: OsmC family protein [Firmicutes bacterium]|nr:OsmC family protein [Bacillota bacterium]